MLEHGGRRRVTVDPYLWNAGAVSGWKKAGFRPVEEREPDDEHPHQWLRMEFDPTRSPEESRPTSWFPGSSRAPNASDVDET